MSATYNDIVVIITDNGTIVPGGTYRVFGENAAGLLLENHLNSSNIRQVPTDRVRKITIPTLPESVINLARDLHKLEDKGSMRHIEAATRLLVKESMVQRVIPQGVSVRVWPKLVMDLLRAGFESEPVSKHMLDAEAEHSFEDGRVTVAIAKVGGGTVGRKYTGQWTYTVVMEGYRNERDTYTCGTSRDHEDAAREISEHWIMERWHD